MIPVKIHPLRLGTLLVMLGGLFGCFNVPVTSIRDVQQQSDTSSMVYLEGEIVKQVPLLGKQAYELQDATGTIWVVTKQKVPPSKQKVLIKVKVQKKNIRLGKKNLDEVYVEEQQRL